MAIEKPAYKVIAQYPDFEVRDYAPYVVAETEVEGELTSVGGEAFARLAGFIFGKNRSARKLAMAAPVAEVASPGTRLAMTAPVTQVSSGEHSWRVQFMMPGGYTLETLPVPDDTRVTLRVQPARQVAVIRYAGRWSHDNYDRHLARLRQGIADAGIVAEGEPVWARYDPPFKPWFLRTNEIMLETG